MGIEQLFICEKPSQARDIARILGCRVKGEGSLGNPNTVVTWCFGHLLELEAPSHYCENVQPWRMDVLPVIPNEWHMAVKSEAKKQFNIIKRLLKEAKTVVIATDADREGELIAREILSLCRFKGGVKRLWLSALDDISIKKALADICEGQATENLYYAGLGRQRADWLVSMNMTMAATVSLNKHKKNQNDVLSVGRVQTPTLKLIVDRDRAIENFKSKDYFELLVQFTTKNNESFISKWQPPKDACDVEGHCLDKNSVMNVAEKIKNKVGNIDQFEEKQKMESSPLCLSLSQLQKIASRRFGLSAQRTLDIAQSLYETHKAITYPRTDCGYLPESQFGEANIILKNLKKIHPSLTKILDECDLKFKSRTWNSSKITAHHGMMPTLHENVDMLKMIEQERQIYDLICRYYLAQFLGDYRYTERSVSVLCEGEYFKTTRHTPLNAGWRTAFAASKIDKESIEKDEIEKDEEANSQDQIPSLQRNETVQLSKEMILDNQTRPPASYTEGTLIEAMKSIGKDVQEEKFKKILKETAGIGTEATRSGIIETLYKRDYIEKRDRKIFSTEKGKQLIDHLPAVVCNPRLTAEMEQALDAIASGELRLESFLSQQKELLMQMLAALQKVSEEKQ